MIGADVTLGAAVLTAVWLSLTAGGAAGWSRAALSRRRHAGPRLLAAAVLMAVAAWLLGPVGPRWWVVSAGVACVLVAVRHLTGKRAARRRDEARRRRVVEFCDALAAELHGGLPAMTALERACSGWAELDPVASATRLDADVPATLRRVAELPGARGLRAVAAAWEVAGRSGAALAVVVERVAVALRHEADARAEVVAALGPPRATAVMLMFLPLFGVGLGASMGADPIRFLLFSTVGLSCLFAGTALALLGAAWVERLATRAEA